MPPEDPRYCQMLPDATSTSTNANTNANTNTRTNYNTNTDTKYQHQLEYQNQNRYRYRCHYQRITRINIHTDLRCFPTKGNLSEVGGAQPGNRFVSFLCEYMGSGCLVELDLKFRWLAFSLFLLFLARSWRFSFLGPGGPGELSRFPFGPVSFPFSLPSPPNLLSNHIVCSYIIT